MRLKSILSRAIASTAAGIRPYSKPSNGLRVLNYHSIGNRAFKDDLNLNSLSKQDFLSHLELIKSFQVVEFSGSNIPTDETHIAITFDYGYADNLYVAAPLLIEFCMPFTVFVTSDFVRCKQIGFLSKAELRELSSLPGVTIGAHSRTHCDLTLCDDNSLHSELSDSRSFIEDVIGIGVTSMAYPFGKANLRVKAAVQRCGYLTAGCSRFDINQPGRDALMLCRSVVLNGDSENVLKQKILGNWDWYRIRSPDPLYIKGI